MTELAAIAEIGRRDRADYSHLAGYAGGSVGVILIHTGARHIQGPLQCRQIQLAPRFLTGRREPSAITEGDITGAETDQ